MDVRETGHEIVAHMQSENSSFTCHVYDGEYAAMTGDFIISSIFFVDRGSIVCSSCFLILYSCS